MTDNILRRSQVLTTFGPGSFVDLPERSVIICGLSQWDKNAGQVIHEPRLVAKLQQAIGVGALELITPPAMDDSPGARPVGIRAQLFPSWFVTHETAANPGKFRRRRLVGIEATEKNGLLYIDPEEPRERQKKRLIPIRFVAACRRGHTEDVDWRSFVHGSKTSCRRTLWIEERGTSGDIGDTFVGCDCGASRRLYDALDTPRFPLGNCQGLRPWLGFKTSQTCGEPHRLLVRNASNAYFAQTMSVISLPDRDENLAPILDEIWEYVGGVETEQELEYERKKPKVRATLGDLTTAEVFSAILRRRENRIEDIPVKEAEFEVLSCGRSFIGNDAPESPFFAETLDRKAWDPNGTSNLRLIERVVLVHRLREVMAQVGFTRFEPPAPQVDGEIDMNVERQDLDRDITWLPAIENKGEGIFIQMSAPAIHNWLAKPNVGERINQHMSGFLAWTNERASKRPFPGGPYLMLHTFSHLLMTAIALECGYPASSLKERIYAFKDRYGVLIHTGTSGAEGTLGGLVETGRRIADHLSHAMEMGLLCSNDPVCAEHDPSDALEKRFLHGAACHGCLLIAETSCEQRNDHLDRALVIPTLATPGASFFQMDNGSNGSQHSE